jgi:hypothetical protein
MSDANKLRFYIDQAIMTRDYTALAAFEDRMAILEAPRTNGCVECYEHEPAPEPKVWVLDNDDLL